MRIIIKMSVIRREDYLDANASAVKIIVTITLVLVPVKPRIQCKAKAVVFSPVGDGPMQAD